MKRAISLFVVMAVTTACIHKESGQVSPWERVSVNLAALAQINQDVAKGVIAVQRSGAISVEQATPILNYQESVAKDHAAIMNILSAGITNAETQSEQIQALLSEIETQGTVLIQSGDVGIRNPQSQQSFSQDLQGIVNLASLVLVEFRAAKGE